MINCWIEGLVMVEGLLPFSLDPEGEVPVEAGGGTLLKPGGLKQNDV